ncbi:hypothetical protein GCM10022384_70970 [Streptomyces marokkonensis]|uniref:Pyrroline-5-carboxylate reductase catalytic N-terminal domain-containing protein n=2 Tax=Streptomyces marokkonensis TaxID=324855 RepID=A0ABP7T3D9_9ACTN
MAGFLIPDAPLPSARHLRLAIVGPDDCWAAALVEVFATVGRTVERLSCEELAPARTRAHQADVAFLTIRTSQMQSVVPQLGDALKGVVTVVCTTSLQHDESGYFMQPVHGGSATELASELLPGSRVVGAFQQFGPSHLALAGMGAFETDVPVIGDDREACDVVEELIDEFRGLEPVYAGGLKGAAAIEGLAALIGEATADIGRPVGFRLSSGGIKILD